MANTRFCILCGEPFGTDDPEEVFCPAHGGKAPVKSGQETIMDAGHQQTIHQPVDPHATRFEGKGTLDADQERAKDFEPPVQDLSDWQVGEVILDTYEVKGTLGKGGFGKVYRAHHKGWNMDLAVKRALKLDEENKQGFINEAQKWIDLGLHPHIISCYYVRNIDGFPHTFAELAEGGSLHDWIGEEQEEQRYLYEGDSQEVLARILDIAIQFAWGLGYAHEQGLVHGDVKPQNALMTPEGVLKVTDFGLARAGKDTADDDLKGLKDGLKPNKIVMSPKHCSPEQYAGQKLSLKTDIWSWAVSVLEMFNGGIYWEGGQVAAYALESYLLRAGDEEDIPAMPGAVAELLRACFQDDPQARPRDMLEIAERLMAIYQQETGQPYLREIPKSADLRADSLNNKALSLLDLGKEDEAVELWQEALKIDPHHAETTYNLGMWRWQAGQQTDLDLVHQLEAVRNIQPNTWMPSYLLGLSHKQRQDIQTAKKVIIEVESLSPGNIFAENTVKSLNKADSFHCLHTLEGFRGALAISPDERKLVLCGGRNKNTGKIWDIESGQCLHILRGHTHEIRELAITPNGQRVISGSGDNTLRVWDIQSGECLHVLAGHTGWIYTLAISPNGRYAISGSGDDTLRVWDLGSGECRHTFFGHTNYINGILITPDGKMIVSRGHLDKTPRIWDIETGFCLHELEGHTETLTALSITRDGCLVISGSTDKTLRFWDIESGHCLHTLLGHEVSNLVISPSGHLVVTGGTDGSLKVWDLENGNCLHTLKHHTERINRLVFTPDGSRVISTSGRISSQRSNNNTLRLWELSTGNCLREFSGHTDFINALIVTRDGQKIISGSRDNTQRIWDIESGRCIFTLEDNKPIAVLHDSRRIISSTDDRFNIWQMPVSPWLKPEWVISQPSGIETLQSTSLRIKDKFQKIKGEISNGNHRQAAVILIQALKNPGFERDLQLLALLHQLGQEVGRMQGLRTARFAYKLVGHTKGVTVLAITPDGQRAVSGSYDKTLRVWDLKTGECLSILEGHSGIISSLAITPDGNQAISGSYDKSLRVWDLRTGKCLHILKEHKGWVLNLSITPDGKKAISGGSSYDLRLCIWDLESGQCLNKVISPGYFALTPNGDSVISGVRGKKLCVWNLENNKIISTMEGIIDKVNALAVTPDGKKVVAGCHFNYLRHLLQIWDLKTGKCLHSLEGHSSTVNNLVVTPDGHKAVSGAADKSTLFPDKTLRVWDLTNGECLMNLEGHIDHINSLAITSDGRRVISGSDDRTIRIWDIENGKCIHTFDEIENEVNIVTLSMDNRTVVSSSNNDLVISVFTLNWDYQFPEITEWDEGARVFLEIFLAVHTTISGGLFKLKKPSWTEEDFQQLLAKLKRNGYGWLREVGVRKKLEEMATERG